MATVTKLGIQFECWCLFLCPAKQYYENSELSLKLIDWEIQMISLDFEGALSIIEGQLCRPRQSQILRALHGACIIRSCKWVIHLRLFPITLFNIFVMAIIAAALHHVYAPK